MRPFVPFSSPTVTVPHGVARTGSHDVRPEAMIVSGTPVARLMRCTPICPAPCSLHAIRCVGWSFGHSTIMSMFGPSAGSALTTLTRRPGATVTSFGGIRVRLVGRQALGGRFVERPVRAEQQGRGDFREGFDGLAKVGGRCGAGGGCTESSAEQLFLHETS